LKKIYSSIEDIILHIIFNKEDFEDRKDIVDPDQFLQVSALKLNLGKTFKPHKHLHQKSTNKDRIAQESWVVIKGSVKVDYYDINSKFLQSEILKNGDCTITLYGGHNYTILEQDTLIYEFKTGPYVDRNSDKVDL
jgi:mannose-6-phosphate isomerase-like protein (cupin superfamily)